MRIPGKAFDGLTLQYNTHNALKGISGGAYLFSQFTPTLSDATRILLDLLVLLYHMDVCCNMSGLFPAFLAGLQHSFGLIVLYVAIENLRIIRVLLQKEQADPYDYKLRPFEIHLENSPDEDICK
jgi:hypothetical protein